MVCVITAAPLPSCREKRWNLEVADDGTFETRYQVFPIIRSGSVEHDCRIETCELWATQAIYPLEEDPLPVARTPLLFAEDSPPYGPAVFTVTPTTDLVDGQTVTMEGQDWGLCDPFFPDACTEDITLRLCRTEGMYPCVVLAHAPPLDGGADFSVRAPVPATGAVAAERFDCRREPCSIMTMNHWDLFLVPVEFAVEDAPPEPAPAAPPASPIASGPSFAG
jgi:hypothetical protein